VGEGGLLPFAVLSAIDLLPVQNLHAVLLSKVLGLGAGSLRSQGRRYLQYLAAVFTI